MVLCQILITPAASKTTTGGQTYNGGNFVVPVSGKCSIRVLSFSYFDTSNTFKILQLQSDVLVFPYSPSRYLTILDGLNANAAAYVQFDVSYREYHLQNVIINGVIQFNLIDRATGAEPAGFGGAIISLEIELINEEFTNVVSNAYASSKGF
jgi:hypothetical protein